MKAGVGCAFNSEMAGAFLRVLLSIRERWATAVHVQKGYYSPELQLRQRQQAYWQKCGSNKCVVIGWCVMLLVLVLLISSFRNFCIVEDPCDVMARNIASRAGRSSKKQLLLPKIIHQQWKTSENIPKMFFHEEFDRLFPAPEFSHIIWTDKTMRDLIASQFPWFLQTYDRYKKNIQRADAARYFILYYYGGVYADMDYQPIVNFWSLLPADRPALVESPYTYDSILQNSLMSSPPRHPFWNATFAMLMSRDKTNDVLESTGPNMLEKVYLEQQKMNQLSYPALLACENFQRVPYSKDTLWITNVFRRLMSWTWMMKPCGDIHDLRCLVGIHHGVASWTFV